MIVSQTVRNLNVFRIARLPLSLMFVYSASVTWLHTQGINIDVPLSIPALLGTAISILLGFRTNAAYDRWWEARKIWGSIVTDSRTWARQVLTLLRPKPGETLSSQLNHLQDLKRTLVYRQICWNFTLKHRLRGTDANADWSRLLPDEDHKLMASQSNSTDFLLKRQAEALVVAHDNGLIDTILFLPLENTLKRMSDHMGKCERIKSTTFPKPYDFMVNQCIYSFLLLIPCGLAPHLGWFALPVVLVVTLVFVLIQAIASYLQHPFENRATDTAMTNICQTIEANLRDQLGETESPPVEGAINGVMM